MGIKKIKKDVETKQKVKQKNVKIKELIENNLDKIYSNQFFTNYFSNNFYEIFDSIKDNNSTLQLINKLSKSSNNIFDFFNICFQKINNLPYCQIVYYFIYKMYNIKVNLKPEALNNFIYHYNNNIIEINFEKYTLQSFYIINDFLKPKIEEVYNSQNIDLNNKTENNLDDFSKIISTTNKSEENMYKENLKLPYIIILHNIHKLNLNIIDSLLLLIKNSYLKAFKIRFILTTNSYLNNKDLGKINSYVIPCESFNINITNKFNIYQNIYEYIYRNNYLNILHKSNSLTYYTNDDNNTNDDDNINDILYKNNYLSYNQYLEIYPYYQVSKINNILIYLLNIETIYILKNNSIYKEQDFNKNTINYLKSKINNIPIHENKLYNILTSILFNNEKLITIIDNIKGYVNNVINYDIDYTLYIKLIINYFNIIINNLDKKIHNKPYITLLKNQTLLYKIYAKYDIVQKKSKFINDFIVYEQVLLHIYKIFYNCSFYNYKTKTFNEKLIQYILNNNKNNISNIKLPIQLST